MKRPVLVTGGAGFIGSHLVEALVRRGRKVRVLDNLCEGRMRNLAGVAKRSNLSEATCVTLPIFAERYAGWR